MQDFFGGPRMWHSRILKESTLVGPGRAELRPLCSCVLTGDHWDRWAWVHVSPKPQQSGGRRKESSLHFWEVNGKNGIHIYFTIEIGNHSIKCFQWNWAILEFSELHWMWFCMLSGWARGDGEHLPFELPLGCGSLPLTELESLDLDLNLTFVRCSRANHLRSVFFSSCSFSSFWVFFSFQNANDTVLGEEKVQVRFYSSPHPQMYSDPTVTMLSFDWHPSSFNSFLCMYMYVHIHYFILPGVTVSCINFF